MLYVWLMMIVFLPGALLQRFRVVVPGAPVFSVSGSDVILSCFVRDFVDLNIRKNAVNMTITWSRSDLETSLVHLYGNHKDLNTDQNPFYRGRTAVIKEQLKNGNVSLKLSNVQISDEGEYTCRVDSTTWENSKTFKLSVEAVGSEPVITLEKYESGKFSLLCESKGWYPEPELQWRNSKEVNLTAETETQPDGNFFNVKSRITVEEIDSYFCTVTQKHHVKEGRIDAQTLYEKFRVVGADTVFSVSGSEVILSCSVRDLDRPNIRINAVDMNVTWFRSDLGNSLVHLYGNHKDLNTDQNPFYRGRTAVFKKQLKNGDVSLKLYNVRISDEGEYRCRVESNYWEDDALIKLVHEDPEAHFWKSVAIGVSVLLLVLLITIGIIVCNWPEKSHQESVFSAAQRTKVEFTPLPEEELDLRAYDLLNE